LEQKIMAEETKTKRVFYADRTLDTSKMSVTYAFTDGEIMSVSASDFPEAIAKHALLAGINTRLGQGMNKAETLADAKQAVKDAVEQLKAGDWSRGPQPNATNQLAEAFRQLAQEQNKTVTFKAMKAQVEENAKAGVWIAGKNKGQPFIPADMMQQEKYLSAYTRSQARTETSLDDLG